MMMRGPYQPKQGYGEKRACADCGEEFAPTSWKTRHVTLCNDCRQERKAKYMPTVLEIEAATLVYRDERIKLLDEPAMGERTPKVYRFVGM